MDAERRQHTRQQVICRVDYADKKGRAWWGLIRDLSAAQKSARPVKR
jgi:hypothetical protein